MLSPYQLLTIWTGFFVGVAVADGLVVTERFYIAGLFVSLAAAWRWRRGYAAPLGVSGGSGWLTASLALVLLLAGVARMEWAERGFVELPLHDQVGQTVELSGQVVREPDGRDAFAQLTVRVDDDLVLVRTDRYTLARYGDTLTVVGTLQYPEPFETDLDRVFDYPGYLQAQGIQYLVPFAAVTVTGTDRGNLLVRGLLAGKERFMAAVTQSLPPPQSDLGLGLLLGVKQGLGDDLEDAFRRTGLIHIVVLSGYNVMLVVGFFWWLSSWALPLRGRVVFGVVGITLFAILVGFSPTVLRASIMAGILLLARYIGTRYDVLRALLFAALVMVLCNPYLLLDDLGFQLSFMATLGLVLFLPQFEATLAAPARGQGVGLRDIFLATVVTQVFVLPLLVFHIGEVSVVSVVVNLLVLPVVGVAMALTFVTGLTALVSSTLALPLAFLTQLTLTYIIVVVEWFDRLSWAAISLPPIGVGELLVLYVLIGLLWYVWQRRTNAAKQPGPSSDQFDPYADLEDWEIVELPDDTVSSTSSDSLPTFLR